MFAKKNGHRACFNSNGIIIDSSARQLLKVKDQKPASAFKGMWTLNNLASPDPILSFKVPNWEQNFTQFNSLSNYIDAINRYLLQLCDQDSFICMFRTKTNHKLRFNGRITWEPTRRRFSWSGYKYNKATGSVQVYEQAVEFSHNGDEDLVSKHFGNFEHFCNDRARVEQYKEIEHFVSEIWETSINELGGGTFIERWIAS
ncbi:hypothetical protein MauCBS54593_004860 [Microsporum audouinii]